MNKKGKAKFRKFATNEEARNNHYLLERARTLRRDKKETA